MTVQDSKLDMEALKLAGTHAQKRVEDWPVWKREAASSASKAESHSSTASREFGAGWNLFAAVVDQIYREHDAGCCWRVVLDDDSADDESISFCLVEARKNHIHWKGHPCTMLSDLLVIVGVERFQRYLRCFSQS